LRPAAKGFPKNRLILEELAPTERPSADLHLKWQHDFPIVVAPPLQDASAGRDRPGGLYLRSLSDRQVIVNIKLRDGETVRGWIEYFDDSMLRLTREGQPNLFIYKHQIRSHQRS
jgi:host factor-I protein